MTDDTIVSLATTQDDNRFLSVEQLLEDALRECKAGELVGKSAILIVLDHNADGTYSPQFRMAKLYCSEAIALLRVVETQLLRMMDFL